MRPKCPAWFAILLVLVFLTSASVQGQDKAVRRPGNHSSGGRGSEKLRHSSRGHGGRTARPHAISQQRPGTDKQLLQQPASGQSPRVSVVMLNWMRPDNVIKIAMTYVNYDSVDEIIIWMCNPKNKFTLSHPKVRIIDDVSADRTLGLSTRFKACLMAKNPWVLIQDDDHYLKEPGLLKLISRKQEQPQRMVGTFGRDWPAGEAPSYIRRPVMAGPCRILLTILLLTDQRMCQAFWDYAPLVEDYVRNHSSPLWNGEDIFLSLVSFKTTGQAPLVVGKVPKVFLSQQSTGVHFSAEAPGFAGHDAYRDQFLKHAVKVLRLDYGGREYGRHVRHDKLPRAKAKQRRGGLRVKAGSDRQPRLP